MGRTTPTQYMGWTTPTQFFFEIRVEPDQPNFFSKIELRQLNQNADKLVKMFKNDWSWLNPYFWAKTMLVECWEGAHGARKQFGKFWTWRKKNKIKNFEKMGKKK